jgi:putative PIN family toxin of toxin-antitoxin system
MTTVFVDTCVWIAAVLSPKGGSCAVVQALKKNDDMVMISSPEVIEEAVRNFSKKYPKYQKEFLRYFHEVHPIMVQPKRAMIIRAAQLVHPDDAPILAAALTAQADYLLTLDKKHFITQATSIQTQTGMYIETPGDFLQQHFSI